MRIEYMREFLVFSRYLNVTHAANELNISQPVLSGHLASIENELGVCLVDRKDGMSLTPEGVLFLEGAENLINEYEDLVKRCKEAVFSKPGKLIFEKPVTSISMEREINSLISDFKADSGNITVKMHVTTNKDLYRSLEDGDVDIGFVWGDVHWDDDPHVKRGFRYLAVPVRIRERQYIWLSKDDPLASKDMIELVDLNGRAVRLPIGMHYKIFNDAFTEKCEELRDRGIDIRINHTAGNLNESALRVKELDIGIIDEVDIHESRYQSVPDRVFIPYAGDDFRGKAFFVCKIGNDNPVLYSFIDYLEKLRSLGIFIGELNDQVTV